MRGGGRRRVRGALGSELGNFALEFLLTEDAFVKQLLCLSHSGMHLLRARGEPSPPLALLLGAQINVASFAVGKPIAQDHVRSRV